LAELTQHLFGAFAKFALPFFAEERSEFGFGDDKLCVFEDSQK